MNLRILPSAVQDLHRGREFYSRQSDSLGEYFLDSLFSDIDSLELYAGVRAVGTVGYLGNKHKSALGQFRRNAGET